MKKIGSEGFACANCGQLLHSDDMVEVCADCGAIFCQECVEDESFENHSCDECE